MDDERKRQQPYWLEWAREIQAIAQIGTHYARDDFQKDRYTRLQELAAEMICQYSTLESDSVLKEFKSQVGYATPKVDVRGAVFSGDKLLLVRELADRHWTLPGGWADVGESPGESVEREVLEESGLTVKSYMLVGIYDANRSNQMALAVFHAYKIIFLCKILDGILTPRKETVDAEFFSLEDIPEDLSRLRTEKRHIEDAFAALMDPDYVPMFD